jgi:RNA polymerase sigma-70 factor, ECF subfamily
MDQGATMTDLATTEQGAADPHGRDAAGRQGTPRAAELERLLEDHRAVLTGYCYRMLGSAFEADDAVQETLVRAWRAFDRFDGSGSLRPWLYRIATNVCLTMLARRQRRALPMDVGPAGVEPSVSRRGVRASTDTPWVGPVPEGLVVAADGDPAALTVERESIRLAFVAALQYLRPRQRAVLILHDVLRWKAREIAELLDTSTVSVNSILRRARAALAKRDLATVDPVDPTDQEQRELLARYVRAFQRSDVESLVSLLHADATMAMPPSPLWLDGRLDICKWFLSDACGGPVQLVPTTANGCPAFGVYRLAETGGRYEPFAVEVVELAGGRIRSMHFFIDATLFPVFGLPASPPER